MEGLSLGKIVDSRDPGFGDYVDDRDRTIDPERCRRIHWIRPILDSFNLGFPLELVFPRWWKSGQPRFRGRRYLLATEDYSYVVVIDERPGYALLVTAYYIEHIRRRRKMREECDGFWEGRNRQEPPTR